MSVQETINKILWNKRVAFIPDGIQAPDSLKYVLIKDITLEDRNFYLIMREIEERRAREQGVSTEAELLLAAKAGNYWTSFEDEIEAEADNHIAFLRSEFELKKKFKSRQNIIQLQIDDALAKKAAVQSKRNGIRYHSAEYLAHQTASFLLLQRLVLHPDGSLLIQNEQVLIYFKNEYLELLYFLIEQILQENPYDNDTLREIARSGEWRLIWCLNRENLQTIFGRSVGDLTLVHKMLIYWSRVYDSAFEGPNPPSKEIIEDNQLFDQWLADRESMNGVDQKDSKPNSEQCHVLDGEYVDICNCGAKAYNKGKGLGERQLHESTCLFGTWHTYSPEEKEAKAKLVYSRNSQTIRKHLDNEHEKILTKGIIEEQHLRGKKTRQLLGMKSNIIPVMKR